MVAKNIVYGFHLGVGILILNLFAIITISSLCGKRASSTSSMSPFIKTSPASGLAEGDDLLQGFSLYPALVGFTCLHHT